MSKNNFFSEDGAPGGALQNIRPPAQVVTLPPVEIERNLILIFKLYYIPVLYNENYVEN